MFRCYRNVSIQLVSPASGDVNAIANTSNRFEVSIQLVSPASGDTTFRQEQPTNRRENGVSIQLVSPASGDVPPVSLNINGVSIVFIQLVSPASGD